MYACTDFLLSVPSLLGEGSGSLGSGVNTTVFNEVAYLNLECGKQ